MNVTASKVTLYEQEHLGSIKLKLQGECNHATKVCISGFNLWTNTSNDV